MDTNGLQLIKDNIFDLADEDRFVGSYLYDKFGEMIGRIQGVMAEPETFQVRYAVYTEGGFLFTEGKTVLVPREQMETLDMGKMKTVWARETLQHGPTITSLEPLALNEESMVRSYFDLEPYWEEEEETS